MNYYSDQEIEQVIEYGNRQPLPATSHVALITEISYVSKRDKTSVWAWAFWFLAFLFVLTANMIQLPTIVLGLFAGLLIAVFVVVTIRGQK